jgi:TolB protein
MRLKDILLACGLTAIATSGFSQIDITSTVNVPGTVKPILVSMSGISGDAAQVIQFDLYVQGFAFTNSQNAQFSISGSSGGDLQAKVVDNISKETKVSKAYSGADIRRQAHTFVDDFMEKLGRKGISRTKIAFKAETGHGSEIYVADFDGHNAQAVTSDGSVVAAPCWVPGKMALYYTSYKLNHVDIFYHNLSTGDRRAFARFGGSNMSPAAAPDGHVAMILSKDGWTDLYVCDSSGGDLRRLTKSPQDESSPCWSPDSRWICYASKEREHRALQKIPVGGGAPVRIATSGMPSPSEPDWSPDGTTIAFTVQYRDFQICVVPAKGGTATGLVAGEDPSWSANSRTLIFARRQGGGRYVLSLLDVPTKQVKDVSRISGISSQSQPSWAR